MNVLLWLFRHSWPLLLVSPSIFLMREVRTKPAMRKAAGAIVAGSYLLLLSVTGPFLISMIILSMSGLGHPIKESVINQDQTFAGILFPEGSRVTTINGGMLSADKLQFIVLSKETQIGGIPAGPGTYVWFSLDNGAVTSMTTGQPWIYQGIPIPAGSTVYLNEQFKAQVPQATSGVSEILISQPLTVVTQIEDMRVHGNAVLRFDGNKLTSVGGSYEWNGKYFRSYSVGGDGQIQRVRELNERRLRALNAAARAGEQRGGAHKAH